MFISDLYDILCIGAKVEFGEMSYTVDEGTTFVSLELVRYSDSRDEMVISLTLRDGTARGEREGEREREREVTLASNYNNYCRWI